MRCAVARKIIAFTPSVCDSISMGQESTHTNRDRPPSRLLNLVCLFLPIVSFVILIERSYGSPANFALIVPYGLLTVIAYAVSMMFSSRRVSQAAFRLFMGCILVDLVCVGFVVLWILLWTTPGMWITK
jgi:hypothetical protein